MSFLNLSEEKQWRLADALSMSRKISVVAAFDGSGGGLGFGRGTHTDTRSPLSAI